MMEIGFLEFLQFHKNNYLFFFIIFLLIFIIPILSKKINFPYIFVLILMGIILGPNNTKIIEKTPIIDFFAKVGLIYIMFLAGLELNLSEFKQNKHKSLTFGMFTFWLPLLLSFPLCYYVIGLDLLGSLLVSSMFSTHTLIAYPIVSKLGLTQREEVVISVSGTMITDTLVLLLFIFISNYAKGVMEANFVVFFLVAFSVYLLFIFLVLTKIAKWIFQKVESETHLQLALVFSFIFLSVYLAESIYLEAIIGAFAAGLALNRYIPSSSVLMQRITFVGNAIFIPIFLISVGMIIDPKVLFKDFRTFGIAILLSVVAIITKGVAAYAMGLFFPMRRDQMTLLYGLTSAHAAATLAIMLVGFELKIVDEVILNSTIILIMLTSLFSSFLTDYIAKKIALQSEQTPSIEETENILIPVVNLNAMDKLIQLAKLLQNHSSHPIHILTVVENNKKAEENIQKAKRNIENYILQNTSEKDHNFQLIAAIETNPASGIAIKAREIMANIIILGWPSKVSLLDKLLGIQKIKTIIENSEKNILITNIQYPLHFSKKVYLFLSEFLEKEKNIEYILTKIFEVFQKLNLEINLVANPKTYEEIQKFIPKNTLKIRHIQQDWKEKKDLEKIFREIHNEDLVVFFCARKGFISYHDIFDSLIDILDETLPKNNKILIYPRQETSESVYV
ncbi:MAG: cation:proton antiporter [Leptospiraceae bacterium]|nr:cation:proton antiporter [Leptospiraceae bacterium]